LEVKEKIDSGVCLKVIADEHFTSYIRNFKAFREYKRIRTEPRSKKSIVVLIYGPSGVGKSRFATQLSRCLGSVYKVPFPKGSGLYWDDYGGEDVAFVDEMAGHFMSPTFFNTLCDWYECLVPAHGGAGHQFTSQYIVICSNYHPKYWWKNRKAHEVVQTTRRIDVMIPFIASFWERKSVEVFKSGVCKFKCCSGSTSLANERSVVSVNSVPLEWWSAYGDMYEDANRHRGNANSNILGVMPK
jgi:hypothetical protein